jgi:hypothetical protein
MNIEYIGYLELDVSLATLVLLITWRSMATGGQRRPPVPAHRDAFVTPRGTFRGDHLGAEEYLRDKPVRHPCPWEPKGSDEVSR